MAGCKGCQDHINSADRPPGHLIGPDGNTLTRQGMIDSAGRGVADVSSIMPSPKMSLASKSDQPVNFDQAIFYASMATDLLLFPLRFKVAPCSCGKDETLKGILLKNKQIIEDVIYLL